MQDNIRIVTPNGEKLVINEGEQFLDTKETVEVIVPIKKPTGARDSEGNRIMEYTGRTKVLVRTPEDRLELRYINTNLALIYAVGKNGKGYEDYPEDVRQFMGFYKRTPHKAENKDKYISRGVGTF